MAKSEKMIGPDVAESTKMNDPPDQSFGKNDWSFDCFSSKIDREVSYFNSRLIRGCDSRQWSEATKPHKELQLIWWPLEQPSLAHNNTQQPGT